MKTGRFPSIFDDDEDELTSRCRRLSDASCRKKTAKRKHLLKHARELEETNPGVASELFRQAEVISKELNCPSIQDVMIKRDLRHKEDSCRLESVTEVPTDLDRGEINFKETIPVVSKACDVSKDVKKSPVNESQAMKLLSKVKDIFKYLSESQEDIGDVVSRKDGEIVHFLNCSASFAVINFGPANSDALTCKDIIYYVVKMITGIGGVLPWTLLLLVESSGLEWITMLIKKNVSQNILLMAMDLMVMICAQQLPPEEMRFFDAEFLQRLLGIAVLSCDSDEKMPVLNGCLSTLFSMNQQYVQTFQTPIAKLVISQSELQCLGINFITFLNLHGETDVSDLKKGCFKLICDILLCEIHEMFVSGKFSAQDSFFYVNDFKILVEIVIRELEDALQRDHISIILKALLCILCHPIYFETKHRNVEISEILRSSGQDDDCQSISECDLYKASGNDLAYSIYNFNGNSVKDIGYFCSTIS